MQTLCHIFNSLIIFEKLGWGGDIFSKYGHNESRDHVQGPCWQSGQHGPAATPLEVPSQGLSCLCLAHITEPQALETNGTLETIMSTWTQTPTNGILSPYDCPWPPTCLGQFLRDSVSSGSHYPATTTLCLINMHTKLHLKRK